MVDGSKCTASGAGIGGGTACAPAKFTVITADASGERVRAGGAKVVVTVTSASVKSSSSDAETPGVVVHDPVDHGDGTNVRTVSLHDRQTCEKSDLLSSL